MSIVSLSSFHVTCVHSEELDELAARLRADGVRPLPAEKDLPDSLDLGHFYTRIYRTGSNVIHYAIGSTASLSGRPRSSARS